MASHRVIVPTMRRNQGDDGTWQTIPGAEIAVNPAHVSTIRPDHRDNTYSWVKMTNGDAIMVPGTVAEVHKLLN
jgi:hypothetical protein